MRARVWGLVVGLAAGGGAAGFAAEPTPPYPKSEFITGVTFDASTERVLAPGSDIWPLTWAADDRQYTVFGDGGGFGGTNSDSRVSFGVARVDGGRRDYVGVNIAGGKAAPHRAPFTGKSLSVLALGDTLYLFRHGTGSDQRAFEFARLYRSDDQGATWQEQPVEFSRRAGDFVGEDAGFFAIAFIQFGRGYEGARDEFVYAYATEIIDPSHWRLQQPGRIVLLRVPRTSLGDKAAYRFFAGWSEGGEPRWTARVTERKPVWEDAVNGTHRLAASYNPGLKRYLLSTMTVDRLGWIGLYEAPEPWGPWRTVLFEKDPARWGSKVITFTFSNKWASADGRDFVLVHTKNDSWCSIEGRFQVPATHAPRGSDRVRARD
jgi:hypothetical protein